MSQLPEKIHSDAEALRIKANELLGKLSRVLKLLIEWKTAG